ncbi:MAG TPA: hypothetical protein VGO62_06420, partial [Myxococcota bacterium]
VKRAELARAELAIVVEGRRAEAALVQSEGEAKAAVAQAMALVRTTLAQADARVKVAERLPELASAMKVNELKVTQIGGDAMGVVAGAVQSMLELVKNA